MEEDMDVEDNIALSVAQEIESTSTNYSQRPGYDLAKFRRTLNSSVIAMFTNLTRVSDDSSDSANKDVGLKLFNCFKNCLEIVPQMFVSCPPQNFESDETDDEKKVIVTKEDVLASAFTEWLLMRLLRVLSEPAVSNMHEKCEDLIVSVLQLIKMKNPWKFRTLFLQLIKMMSELMSFNEKLYTNITSEEKFTIEQYFISEEVAMMEESDGLDLTDIPIVITNPVSCEHMQVKLMFLLNRLISDLVQFLPDQCDNVWQMLCLQIELGDLDLKQASLQAVTSMIQAKGVPLSEQPVSYLLDCLQSLIHLCCSGQVSNFEEQESLEAAVAACLECVLKAVTSTELTFTDRTFALNSLFQNIMQAVISYGLTNLQTKDLQAAIGDGLCILISFFKYHNCELPWDILLKVQGVFINHFGKLDDHKMLSSFLILLIKLEVSRPSFMLQNFGQAIHRPVVFEEAFSSYLSKCIAPDSSDKSHGENCDQNITNDKCPLYIKMKQSSPTWSSILSYLQNVLRNCSFSPGEQVPAVITNAVKTCVEILVSSAFKGDSMGSEKNKYVLSHPGTSVGVEKSCLFVDVMRSLHSFIIRVSSSPSIASRVLFRELVTLASLLINLQDCLQLTDEMLKILCNVFSIPWLIIGVEGSANSELPFLPVGSIQHWRCFLSSEAEEHCLRSLSLLPKNVHSQWRLKILTSCLEADDTTLRQNALETLPLFIHTLELSKCDISDVWRRISEDENFSIVKTLPYLIGKLSCVLNSSCVLCRTTDPSGTLQLPCKLLCKICDGVDLSSRSLSSLEGDTFFQAVLVNSLRHPAVEVRTGTLCSIPSYFSHNEITEELMRCLMELILDPDISIRMKFNSLLSCIVKPAGREQAFGWTSAMSKIVVEKLKLSLNVVKKENMRVQETILEAFGELGKASKDEILLTSLLCLLKNLVSENPLILVVTRTQLSEICDSKNLKMYDLFRCYREKISKFLANTLMKCDVDDMNKLLRILEQFRIVFGFRNVRLFMQATQRYILPYIVAKMAPETLSLLKLYSETLDVSKRNLLLNSFPFVFTHLVKNHSESEMESILGYIQEEANLEFGRLLRCNFQQVHNELLLHFSIDYKKIYSGLMTLAIKNDKLSEKERIISTDEDMAAYLQPKLLGFLVFFDSQLLRSAVTMDDKKLALRSLVTIMNLMGPRYITTVRFKIMATLQIALRFKDTDFPKICCDAWKMLVHSVDVQSLGSILNQVVVALLPILEREPAAVAEIFDYLIIQNQSNLKEYFHDLYFIPDIPELEKVNQVLQHYIADSSSQNDFRSLLAHSLRGLNHENLDVRLHALAQVKQVLQAHQVAVHEHLLTSESVDNVISNLVSVLIARCRETDERARTLLGECLGELGAVDSGRLEIKSKPCTETLSKFYPSVEEESFAYSIIKELVHCYLAAFDCRNQDCSAFAIQELLKIYKCSDEITSSALGRRLWQKFSPDIQEILSIFHNSQYKASKIDHGAFPRPIYRSSIGSEFEQWITNWYFDLVQKVKQETAAKIFQSCSMIVKYDSNCAVLLLPYIVVYGLLDGTESESEQIRTEVVAVLTHSGESDASTQSNLCHLSCQTVFSVFDHLNKWIQHREHVLAAEAAAKKESGPRYNQDKGYVKIKKFISQIPQILLAKSSFSCQAYTRALMHLEQHIKNSPSEFKSNISFLQKLYAALDEPDGVSGIAAVREEDPSLKDLMLEHEATGQLQDAFSCYEKAIKIYPEETNNYVGLLKCFMEMDQPKAALTYANGLLKEKLSWKEHLNAFRVEAAWKLSSWDDLERFLEHEPASDKWNVGLGKILLSSRKGDVFDFKNQLKIVRNHQMAPLSAAAMENGAYLRGYIYLARLHMLTDLEKGIRTLFDWNEDPFSGRQHCDINRILSEWKSRKQLVQSSLRYQEPILNLHRVLLQMAKGRHPDLKSKFNHEIAHCWLQSAKLARKSGHQQRAYSCLLEASTFNSPALFMEKTKWHWNKGEKEQAINTLQKGIQEHFPDIVQGNNRLNERSSEDQRICAKAKLLLAIYSEESAITDSNSLIQMYRDVVSIQPRWEESHFHLAKYFDKMLSTIGKQDSLSGAKADIAVHVAKNFGASLKYGCKHVYHSLPRLLDVWFDMGTQVAELSNARRQPSSFKQIEAGLTQLNNVVMPELFEKLPLFLFLTAFPQMISRICHSHPEVSTKLQGIIAKLLSTYQQQVIWMMMAVSKSSYPTRVQRCKQIFQVASKQNVDLHKFISDTTKLADKLIELSNKSVTGSNVLSINQHFQILPRLISDKHFSPVMIPLQSQMLVTLPSSSGSLSNHNPFPQTTVYIHSFHDTVEIFSSLQRPKKMVIKGTDGKFYSIICKPKDDLRKDCRLIEFNNLVNRYLKSDPEARKRQLYIRTYAVVPLNEECGLIEFVPNLSGLRQILNRIYKYKGLYVSGTEIRAMMPSRNATTEEKKRIYLEKFLPRFPPVFNEWFLRTFPDPTAWYLARVSYARTTAVMSMVGYIVGLGDRHGENILFDSSCGDTVHVDLNCLFNKGETMECPEVVPFRLTHNMVDAMGPTGFEGVFRKACEVTMRVMRSQTDALMSVLRPFVHDPLVEWSRSARSSRSHQSVSGEIRNEMGLTHVKDIEQRLNGLIKMKNKQQYLPLSIEGQVNYLINEATDIQNLSLMYVGWAAYM